MYSISDVWDLEWFRSRRHYKINMAHTNTYKILHFVSDFLDKQIIAHFIANRNLSHCLYIIVICRIY